MIFYEVDTNTYYKSMDSGNDSKRREFFIKLLHYL